MSMANRRALRGWSSRRRGVSAIDNSSARPESRTGGSGGSAPGGAILARETVDEYLAPQLGELPGEVAGVGKWDALAWGLGFDVRGTREPHWTGTALSASASSHFGADTHTQELDFVAT